MKWVYRFFLGLALVLAQTLIFSSLGRADVSQEVSEKVQELAGKLKVGESGMVEVAVVSKTPTGKQYAQVLHIYVEKVDGTTVRIAEMTTEHKVAGGVISNRDLRIDQIQKDLQKEASLRGRIFKKCATLGWKVLRFAMASAPAIILTTLASPVQAGQTIADRLDPTLKTMLDPNYDSEICVQTVNAMTASVAFMTMGSTDCASCYDLVTAKCPGLQLPASATLTPDELNRYGEIAANAYKSCAARAGGALVLGEKIPGSNVRWPWVGNFYDNVYDSRFRRPVEPSFREWWQKFNVNAICPCRPEVADTFCRH